MNREIKFRAWQDGSAHLRKPKMFSFEQISTSWSLHEFLNPKKKGRVLMQLTGLKDKDGVDIYESDLLFDEDNSNIYEIKWVEQLASFYLSIPNTQRGKEVISCAASKVANQPMRLYKIKIIGNIYENPELIKP